MNELLIWIFAATLVVGIVLLVWLGRRRQQRARDATARREAQRVALEQAEHVARAQRLAAEREHANAEPAPLAGAVEAQRLAEQARGNADAGREGADITRRIAEGEAARIAREQALHDAAQAAELAERQAREQAERDAAAAAEAAAVEAAAAARRAEEAEAARLAAEARDREEAERLARETAERAERDAAAAAAEEAARQAAEVEAARLAAEAREQQQREQQAREQAAREQAAREAAHALEAARLAEEARERAEREAAAEAARLAAEAQAQAARAAAAAAAAAPTRELRADETLVLVADDSKIVRVKLSRLLVSQGYRAALAESGEQALELLAAEPPHLLITDVEMPGIDGFELTRQLRAAPATAALPIVMITSSDDKQEEARAAGVTQLLGKPYSEQALIAAIEQARLAVRVPA